MIALETQWVSFFLIRGSFIYGKWSANGGSSISMLVYWRVSWALDGLARKLIIYIYIKQFLDMQFIYIICIEIHKHGWYVDGQAGMLRTKMHDFFAMNRRLPDGTLPQSQRFWNPRLTTLDLRWSETQSFFVLTAAASNSSLNRCKNQI